MVASCKNASCGTSVFAEIVEWALLSLVPIELRARIALAGNGEVELVTIKSSSILIVDRRDAANTFLASCLSEYHKCVQARSAEQAIELLSQRPFDLVMTDITMTDPSGIALCVFINRAYPDSIVVAVSGLGGIQYEIEAMRQGAFEYIEEPFDSAEVCASVEHALRYKALFGRFNSSAGRTGYVQSLLEGAYDTDGTESATSSR